MSWLVKKRKKPQTTTNNVIAAQLEEPQPVIAASQRLPVPSSQLESLPNQFDLIPTYGGGLIRLEATNFSSCEGPYCLDIVAIHGLNGNAYSTWTNGNGRLWLQEDLPRSLPGARIYSYNYDSKIWSSSRGEVRDWAKTILICLNGQRRSEPDQKRGIVFLCHSLGGIVCKRALIEANEDPSFLNILKSTKAIVFFGTPHAGSEQADFASVLGLIAESLGTVTLTDRIVGHRIRRDLVDLLRRQSKELEELSMSFRNRLLGIEIVSFYEQDTMRGFKKLIVPRNSALLNCPGEHQLPSPGKDHRTMCQLDRHDDEYKYIIGLCERYVDGKSKEDAPMLEKIQTQEAKPASELQERRNHEKDLNKQQKCLGALRLVEIEMMDRRAQLATPVPGTCDWILAYPKFRTWISSNSSDVLHLTGDMGSGKTTMMSFLVNHFKNCRLDNAIGIKPFTVCSFFCSDQHHHFRDAVWILRGILYQLLDKNEALSRSMHTAIVGLCDIPAENWNQSLLWPQLEIALNNTLAGPVLLIIDALDECQERSASLLLENINSLLDYKSQNQNNCVKVLISSRPTLGFKHTFLPFVTTISVDAEEIFEKLQDDVQRFIDYEMGRLAIAGHWTQEMSTILRGELTGKAGASFLWARLVLNRMKIGSQDMGRLRKVIDESPKDLDQFYCHILAEIDDDNRDLAAKMLRLLVGSMRPLTTQEFTMALAIVSSENQSVSLEEIERARDCNIKQSIRNALKSLAYIRGNKVHLYHLSTKEFLLRLSVGKVDNLESFSPRLQSLYGITLHAANLDLARATITFLGLDDFNEDMDKTQDETLSAFAELPAYTDDDDQLPSPLIAALVSPSLSSSSSEDGPAFARMLSVKEKIAKHLFYAYSATYWASHLRLVGPTATKDLLESSIHISDPSENCLMHWSDLYRSSSQEWVALPKPLDPLIISAFFGVVSLARETFTQLHNLDEKSKSFALCWACRMGHVDVVELLLAHTTNLIGHKLDGRWPVSWACVNGHLEIVEMLLKEDRESQINLSDQKGRSPLSLAVEYGGLATTKLLIATEGIDLGMTDSDGCIPIHWSVGSKMGSNDVKQLKFLLTIDNMDISKRDNWGRTVLSWAAEKGALKAIDTLLRSKRPEIDTLLEDTGDTSYGRSPLGYAAFYGHADVVEALCKTRRVNAQLASIDRKGQNAVVLATDRNNWEVVKVLAKYYPEGVHVPDQDGRTPLSAAMWAGDNENNVKTIRTLLESGVDVNTRSITGRTPLSYAAAAGRVKIVRILIEEGDADMDIADNEGLLPEDHCMEVHNEMVKEEFKRLRASRSAKKA